MRVVICGAGQVGFSIAQQLVAEGNEVSLIDKNPELIEKINTSIDARGHLGFASHPGVMRQAGADEADMLIAVTYSDEVNMVACQIGYSLFNIPTKIARVRHQQYLQPEWGHLFSIENMALDVTISPEIEVAETILRRFHAPGTMDVIPFADNALQVIAVRCEVNAPISDLPMNLVEQKIGSLSMKILGIRKDDRFVIPSKQSMIKAKDEIYYVVATKDMKPSLALFGHHEREARRVIILGGGNIGLYIADSFEKDEQHDARAKLIEYNKQRAEYVAGKLRRSTVIHGSGLDRDILMEAGIDASEAIISVTNDDETNILSSLLARRYGCQRSIALVNNASYAPLWGDLGIDVAVNPRETTVSSILRHVRRGKIRGVHSIADGTAEVLEAEVVSESSIAGKAVGDLDLPKDVVVGAIICKDTVTIPTPETHMHDGDRVLVMATADRVRHVEKIFCASAEIF